MTQTAEQSNFLGLEPPLSDASTARYHVIPVPYERTVSYGKGTSNGPAAILNASLQVEHYDYATKTIPAEAGIHTRPALDVRSDTSEKMVEKVSKTVSEALELGRIPVTLGGEHSVTVGAIQALSSNSEPPME